MVKRTLKWMLAVALTVTAFAAPVPQAQAADLAFPILFVPVWSQNQSVAGVVTDTRVTIFIPGRRPFGAPGFDVLALIFDKDEKLISFPSIPMTAFDVEVLTGPTLPDGTGTMILINTLAGASPPPVAFVFPLTATVEIGVKAAASAQLDPVPAGLLSSVIAAEAQLFPAVAGEFPRVEVTTSAANPGTPLFFPGSGFETIIVESCLLTGIVHNYYVDDNEKFLFDRAIPCTGIRTAAVSGVPTLFGPDLLIMTPDDGGLLGTAVAPANIPQDTSPPPVPADYHLMAIDVNTFGGPLAGGETFFHGQAAVYLPGSGGTKEAYSYNMPANYFLTRAQVPTAAVACDGSSSGVPPTGPGDPSTCLGNALNDASAGVLSMTTPSLAGGPPPTTITNPWNLCTVLGQGTAAGITPAVTGMNLINCQ